jgi:hypothetical protein
MNNDDSIGGHDNIAKHFESIFQRLLAGETLDLYAEGVSSMFEVIAANLLAEVPERKLMWYDGVVGLTASVRKAHQVEFRGEIWVGDVGDTTQWKEDFRATVTDKRITKQGIWVILCVGADRAEGDLLTTFGLTG